MKQSMVQILRPDFVNRTRSGMAIIPLESDYIVVPRLTQRGTWKPFDMIDDESLAKLAILRDRLAGVIRRRTV